MYIHPVMRTQFFGSRSTCLARLRHAWLAEVAIMNITCFVAITYFWLTTAERLEVCPVRVSVGHMPHREEV